MVIRAKRANESDDIFYSLIGKLRLSGHPRVAELRSTLLNDCVDMKIRKLIHVSAIRMIAWLRIHCNGGRAIAFAGAAMAWRAGFHIFSFAGGNMFGAHIDGKVCGFRTASGNRSFIILPVHLPTR